MDAFGPDEHYEDEEVTYVTLDLGSIEPTLVPSSTTYRLIVSTSVSFSACPEPHRRRVS